MKISRGASLDRFYIFKLLGFGAFFHRIHHSDPPGVFHSHPWNGISFILGKYRENFLDDTRERVRRGINFVSANRHHRTVVNTPVWTLFVHGRKCNQWSVKDTNTNQTVASPWEGEKGFKDYTCPQLANELLNS